MRDTNGTALVVGIGNILLRDEGFGVHVARALLAAPCRLAAGVEILDAGTSLFDALPELARHRWVILVDAIRAGGAPGTLYRAEGIGAPGPALLPTWPSPAAAALSLHDWGAREALHAARLLDLLPERITIVGAEPDNLRPGIDLSGRLVAARDRLVALLLEELCSESSSPARPASDRRLLRSKDNQAQAKEQRVRARHRGATDAPGSPSGRRNYPGRMRGRGNDAG